MLQDPRFSTPAGRRDNWAQLRDIIQGWLKRFGTVDEAVDALSSARVPCAPVLSPAEVVALPHLAERQFFPSVPHPGRGEVRITRSPFRLDGQPVLPQGAAPYRVGEHTRAVLEEFLGYDPGRIEKLLALGAAAAP